MRSFNGNLFGLMLAAYSVVMCAQHQENNHLNVAYQLPEAPTRVERFYEIATQYNPELPRLWNSLCPQERIFAYYLMRASVSGNRIMADQMHRDAVEIIELFVRIVDNQEQVRTSCRDLMDVDHFLSDAHLYLTYLLAGGLLIRGKAL